MLVIVMYSLELVEVWGVLDVCLLISSDAKLKQMSVYQINAVHTC